MICQSHTSIHACAGMATAVVGNYALKSVRDKYLANLKAQTAETARALEAKLNQQWLAKELERVRKDLAPLIEKPGENGASEIFKAKQKLEVNLASLSPLEVAGTEVEYAPRVLAPQERQALLAKLADVDEELKNYSNSEVEDTRVRRRRAVGGSSTQQKKLALLEKRKLIIQEFYESVNYRSAGPLHEVYKKILAVSKAGRNMELSLGVPDEGKVEQIAQLREEEQRIVRRITEENVQLKAKIAELEPQKRELLLRQSRLSEALENTRNPQVKLAFDAAPLSESDSKLIPKDVLARNSQIATEVSQTIADGVAQGKIQSQQALIAEAEGVYRKLAHVSVPEGNYLALESISIKEMMTKVFSNITQEEISGTAKAALRNAYRLAISLGSRAPLVLGGVAGFVAGEILGSSPTACAEVVDNYIHRDSHSRCRPKYEVNDSVMKFLSLPQEKQLELLEDPKICDYYKNLHQKFFRSAKITSLKCSGSGFEIETHTPDGSPHKDKVVYRNTYSADPGGIRQITVQEPGISPWPIDIASDDEVIWPSSSAAAEVIPQLRLYISDAYACCTTRDDRERTECLSKMNENMQTVGASRKKAAPVKAKW